MPFEFTLEDGAVTPITADEVEIDGEDIYCRGGGFIENSNGDLGVVTGQKAAEQSVERELLANNGTFPRRPEWGSGIPALQFKGQTQAVREKAQSRALARMLVNPRLVKVHEVTTTPGDDGMVVSVRADTMTGHIDTQTVIKPPGVS